MTCHPVIRAMEERINLNATVVFTRKENIRATTTGYLQRVLCRQGQHVAAGQTVAELITKEADALGQAWSVDSTLTVQGTVDMKVRHGGVVTQVFFQEGDYVMEGDVLADLINPASMAIRVLVPYQYHAALRSAGKVSVLLPDGNTIPCQVGEMLPMEDIPSQTTPFLLHPVSGIRLPENLNLTVMLPVRRIDSATAVPLRALQSNEEQSRFWVMEVVADSMAIRQEVLPGIMQDSLVQIQGSGLNAESLVVCRGGYALPDSARVRTTLLTSQPQEIH